MVGRKRTLGKNLAAVGVFLAICLAGNVSGFAATLPAGSQQLGAGADDVAACQSSPFNVTFDTGYDVALGGYAVTAVRLSGLDTQLPAGCGGHQFQIALADIRGAVLSERTGTTPLSGTAFDVDITQAHVRASDVAYVELTISG